VTGSFIRVFDFIDESLLSQPALNRDRSFRL